MKNNIGAMMKQAQMMQQRMQDMQNQLERVEITGSSGGGLVHVTMTGKGIIRHVKLDPSLFKQEEKEIVEDLICAACNDAKNKVEQHVSQEMSKITGGLQLPPGFKMPF
ncbi:MAG: YbaB/EbfC family nucleoid-associated protein [Alphaproteobacteria bacterium]|jgi:hypothetical protein|nr:YbaB/EbfC family nucleoid-associated protein [Alphaproteobacteria bacterium]